MAWRMYALYRVPSSYISYDSFLGLLHHFVHQLLINVILHQLCSIIDHI